MTASNERVGSFPGVVTSSDSIGDTLTVESLPVFRYRHIHRRVIHFLRCANQPRSREGLEKGIDQILSLE